MISAAHSTIDIAEPARDIERAAGRSFDGASKGDRLRAINVAPSLRDRFSAARSMSTSGLGDDPLVLCAALIMRVPTLARPARAVVRTAKRSEKDAHPSRHSGTNSPYGIRTACAAELRANSSNF